MTDATSIDMPIQRVTITEATFARERRHSRLIRFLRIALPGAAVLMIAVLMARTVFTSITGISIDLAGTMLQGGKLVMDGPQMSGFTEENRRYELRAERAIQDIRETDSVDLEVLKARLPVGVEDWADVDAETATLYRADGKLLITSPTLITTTDGLKARLQRAEVVTASGEIRGTESVEVDTGGLKVTSDQLTVKDRGALMVFENNVKMTIQPGALSASENEADNAEN